MSFFYMPDSNILYPHTHAAGVKLEAVVNVSLQWDLIGDRSTFQTAQCCQFLGQVKHIYNSTGCHCDTVLGYV